MADKRELSGQDIEHEIVRRMPKGTEFTYGGRHYTVTSSGKPSSLSGEPKTDVYIAARSDDGKALELKISCKKDNADFLENKVSADRARQLLGDDYEGRIRARCDGMRDRLASKQKAFATKAGRTDPGSITLGWRLDLMNKPSGDLSAPLATSYEDKLEVYSGALLPADKRDAFVNGRRIGGSGVANQFYKSSTVPDTPQGIVDTLQPMDDYVRNDAPDVYMALKAVNYRLGKDKWDGNRPLAVTCDWSMGEDGMLRSSIDYSHPLSHGANESGNRTRDMLHDAGIATADDLARHIDDASDASTVTGGGDATPATSSTSRSTGTPRTTGSATGSRTGRRARGKAGGGDTTYWVDTYTRSDGVRVTGHWVHRGGGKRRSR